MYVGFFFDGLSSDFGYTYFEGEREIFVERMYLSWKDEFNQILGIVNVGT